MAEIFIDELLRMLSIGFNPIIIMFISSSLRIFVSYLSPFCGSHRIIGGYLTRNYISTFNPIFFNNTIYGIIRWDIVSAILTYYPGTNLYCFPGFVC